MDYLRSSLQHSGRHEAGDESMTAILVIGKESVLSYFSDSAGSAGRRRAVLAYAGKGCSRFCQVQ